MIDVHPRSARDLWLGYVQTRDPALRDALILQYAPLVRYVIGRMAIVRPAIFDSDDILSEGTIGLMEAVDRFDPTVGVKFETYAIRRIRGSITDSLRRADLHSRGALRRLRRVEQALNSLHQSLQRHPTDREVTEYLGISTEEYREVLIDANLLLVPIDGSAGPDEGEDGLQLTDVLTDTRFPLPEAAYDRLELLRTLEEIISELPERERLVLSLYYDEELTLREIGQVLDVSESRVCQIHGRLLLRLRGLLESRLNTDPRARSQPSLAGSGRRV